MVVEDHVNLLNDDELWRRNPSSFYTHKSFCEKKMRKKAKKKDKKQIFSNSGSDCSPCIQKWFKNLLADKT